ncbi:MAG: ATP-dependent zinc metalloprotease FtsH [Chloroflexi bacterium]|nr:ATP-dependent zinc metalloprotease FtsH [Chloroflexota bacterium]
MSNKSNKNNNNNDNMRAMRNSLLYIGLLTALAFFVVTTLSRNNNETTPTIEISQVAQYAREGQVKRITVNGQELSVDLTDGRKVQSRKEDLGSVVETLRNLGVPESAFGNGANQIQINIKSPSLLTTLMPIILSVGPVLLLAVFFIFLMRQAQGAGNQAFMFGKSKARVFTGDKPTVTFADVAGAEESKQELQEVVEFLKEPQKFASLGARIPKGVLLVGSPGTGKTLMAKAISGEAGVPFFSISGSEFVEMFVGVGASRVRDLFEQAKRNSPCIIFIDEIDAVGRQRGAGLGGSHDEREQTLNQILVEMDGFDTDTNVILIAATNRPDVLDPALLRPGRFDRQVVMDRPDVKGREAILKVHVKGKPLEPSISLETIAKSTPGFVGADIENLVNEAAILAARRSKKTIGMPEFAEAVERVIAGPERRSRLITDQEKQVVAYHEAGHALVMKLLPNADPVHKISIVSRGMALGYTMPLPEEDHVLYGRNKFRDELAGLLGGRVAEEEVFGDITTGASNDLERVSSLARRMVTQYGMSDVLGPQTFGEKEELVFLGREIGEQRNYSEEIAESIDKEVRRLVDEAYSRATDIIRTYRAKLDELAHRLIEQETVDAAEFQAMFA